AAHLAMALLVVAAETMLLVSLPSTDEFLGMHFAMLFLLAGFVSLKSSSSYQQEKECGAFELLLVTPLRERQIVGGRLRAVGSYYAPAAILLILFGALGARWLQERPGEIASLSFAVDLTSICASLISVPVAGL